MNEVDAAVLPRPRSGIGLCLSGGGYRAMLFHTGALLRLNELGWLSRLTRVSSVSGGSLTAGTLAAAWHRLRFSDGIADNFVTEVVLPIRSVAGKTLDVPAILKGVLLPWRSTGQSITASYARLMFGRMRLADLDPNGPLFVFNATDLRDGELWTFSREAGPRAAIDLATVVAASNAVPPFLSPVLVPNPTGDGTEIALADAGVYDNLGLDPVIDDCEIVLVSDSGLQLADEGMPRRNWLSQVVRALDIGDSQVRHLRVHDLWESYVAGEFGGAFWTSYSNIANYELPDALPAPFPATIRLATVPSRQAKLPDLLQEQLINWGYAICDAGMRRWVDPSAVAPAGFPYPDAGVGATLTLPGR